MSQRSSVACAGASVNRSTVIVLAGEPLNEAAMVRIDIAVINGELSAYELGSDRDTLDRLPHQAEINSSLGRG